MDIRKVAGTLHLIAGVVFVAIGLMATPPKKVYMILGVVFLLIGVVRFRRSRSGPPPS